MVLGDSGQGPCHLPNLPMCSEEDGGRIEKAYGKLPPGEEMGNAVPVNSVRASKEGPAIPTFHL